MNQAALEARAIQRAHDERVYIRSVKGRPGVYTTRSKSESGLRYTLVAKAGIEGCSCKGFEYRQSCKHIEALRSRLAREESYADAVEASYVPAVRVRAAVESADLLYG